MTNNLAIERQGAVGLITLNRPERHNAFDDVLIAELTEALRSMEGDDGVRLVVLSGAGKSFSAGADLHWMKRMSGFSKDENLLTCPRCQPPHLVGYASAQGFRSSCRRGAPGSSLNLMVMERLRASDRLRVSCTLSAA